MKREAPCESKGYSPPWPNIINTLNYILFSEGYYKKFKSKWLHQILPIVAGIAFIYDICCLWDNIYIPDRNNMFPSGRIILIHILIGFVILQFIEREKKRVYPENLSEELWSNVWLSIIHASPDEIHLGKKGCQALVSRPCLCHFHIMRFLALFIILSWENEFRFCPPGIFTRVAVHSSGVAILIMITVVYGINYDY